MPPRKTTITLTLCALAAVLTGSLAVGQADPAPAAVPPSPASKLTEPLVRLYAERGGEQRIWVFFTDKGITGQDDYDRAIAEVAAGYNPRAIHRRELRADNAARGGALFDHRDLPLVESYVKAVTATGARLRITSTWLNAMSATATHQQAEAIAALPFVSRLQPVARSRRPEVTDVKAIDRVAAPGGTDTLDYGAAASQLTQINLIDLHDAGYTGAGVIVGVLDTGFRRSHDAFNQPGHVVDIVAEYDFVDDDPNTAPEVGDPTSQHNHGTMILGTIGSYYPGQIVGGAFDASFVLAKTEDTTDEYPAEEDFYVAGLQFIEANGGDMFTSSLGYIDWYTQGDLDGQTAVTTIGVNVATANGVHGCTAAGNEGHDTNPSTSHLIAPSDAFEVFGCGAVNSFGEIASFSSDGPTADGRVKPEVCARGVSTSTVDPNSDTGYTTASGTSLSTPLVACAVACLIQAHPEWTPAQMRDALFNTADYFVANGTYDPQYLYGYGVINAHAASQGVSFAFPDGRPSVIDADTPTTIAVEINENYGDPVQSGSEKLFHRFPGAPFTESPLTPLGGNQYEATLPATPCGQVVQYYFQATTTGGTDYRAPGGAPDDFFQAEAWIVDVVFHDNFETNTGWTAENLGAISGFWERGVPVNDPGWEYDPVSDSDGSGQCYLTQNEIGNTDVDEGAVRLTSPVFDMSGGGNVSYDYYLYLTNTTGAIDRLLVEANNTGGSGAWAEVALHTSDGGLTWRNHEITEADLIAAGVPPTEQMMLRFTANDGDPQSIVESGLDAFKVMRLHCDGGCPSDINGDGTVNVLDLLDLLAAWGEPGGPADINGDGIVDVLDLLDLLAAWGPCP